MAKYIYIYNENIYMAKYLHGQKQVYIGFTQRLFNIALFRIALARAFQKSRWVKPR